MKYISAEEFLSQPKEVQEIFKRWWKPEFGDLFLENYCNIDSEVNIVGCVPINKKHFEDYNGDIHYKKELTIPLLTEGQLRQFIEDKTNTKVLTEFTFGTENYSILCFSNSNSVKYFIYELGNDLLQAYWKVACKIAIE